PEGQAAPDDVLPQKRLRLVDPEGNRLPEHGPAVLFEEALFVERMAALVDRTHQPGKQVLRIDSRRDTYVRRVEVDAERVHRLILAARLEVVAHFLQNPDAEVPLRRGIPLLL